MGARLPQAESISVANNVAKADSQEEFWDRLIDFLDCMFNRLVKTHGDSREPHRKALDPRANCRG